MSFVSQMRQFFDSSGSSDNPRVSPFKRSQSKSTSSLTNHRQRPSIAQLLSPPSTSTTNGNLNRSVLNEPCIPVSEAKARFESMPVSALDNKRPNGKPVPPPRPSRLQSFIRKLNQERQSKGSSSNERCTNNEPNSMSGSNSNNTPARSKESSPSSPPMPPEEHCCPITAEDPKEVVIRLKTEEGNYDNRAKYQSIFEDAPLYQDIYIDDDEPRISIILPNSEELSPEGIQTEKSDKRISLVRSPAMLEKSNGSRFSFGGPSTSTPTSKFTCFTHDGPGRQLWADMIQVKKYHLDENISPIKRKLYETRFEVITSEASYYRSLTVLIDTFYKAPEFDCTKPDAVISAYEKHHLFSNILEIHLASENFLTDLEEHWKKKSLLSGICKIIYRHIHNEFDPYVAYVKNQHYQFETVKCLQENSEFSTVVTRLQSESQCGMLDLSSFLLLPMQRVTRIRLLIRSVIDNMINSDPDYEWSLKALAAAEMLLKNCEDQKQMMEQKAHILKIFVNLEFCEDVKTISAGNRILIKEGLLKVMAIGKNAPAVFKKKVFSRNPDSVQLYLFQDILLIARMKKNGRFLVEDSCPRGGLYVSDQSGLFNYSNFNILSRLNISIRDKNYNSRSIISDNIPSIEDDSQPLFRLVLIDGAKGMSEYFLEAPNREEQEDWIEALSPSRDSESENKERFYENWDHPVYVVTKPYYETADDALPLRTGEIIKVMARMPDGMCKGVTVSSNQEGWFPESYTSELNDDHVRWKNAKKLLRGEDADRKSGRKQRK